MIKKVTILGATGSIGQSTLAVIAANAEHYEVFALTANSQAEKLFALCEKFKPRYAVLLDEKAAVSFKQLLVNKSLPTELLVGQEALCQVSSAAEVDIVMAAIVGAAGLAPTLAAVKASKKVLLANKEVLVMAGELFISAVQQYQATLLPVDSEHNAIFQCLPNAYLCPRLIPRHFFKELPSQQSLGVDKIILTGSGGAFRDRALDTFDSITPTEACKHPNWDMGPKVTVDSATMMNKGLELIEAHYLFGMPTSQIDIVVHPQSIIHSMVNYRDGSTLAQLGWPDMRTPIANALAWPERISSGVEPLDWLKVARLDFRTLDTQRYPCVPLAYEALAQGGTAPAILNAANEVAVANFLAGKMPFTAIAKMVELALEKITKQAVNSLETVIEADQETRQFLQAVWF